MNFLPQTLIVEKLLAVANELLPTLPENDHKELLINALHEFESAITPSAIYLEEVHGHTLGQNFQLTNQQARLILQDAASDIQLNYAGQAVEYHVDQFMMKLIDKIRS